MGSEFSMETVAIVYDFDGTLAKGYLQNSTLLPDLQQEPKSFWADVKKKTQDADADEILVYMQQIIVAARKSSIRITN